jgi:hypothetical protein
MKLSKTLLMTQLTLFVVIITKINPEQQSFLESGLTIRAASLDEFSVTDEFIKAFVEFI